jgi:hypothetical protein
MGTRGWMRRVVQTSAVVLLLTIGAMAQRFDGEAKRNQGTYLQAIPSASVKICGASATGTPCSPGATLYTDATLGTSTGSSTLTADANGNYHFYAQPGLYKIQITDPTTGNVFTQNDQVVSSSAVPDWIDLAALGVACDGTTNDDTILHAALASACSAHKTLKLPEGRTCAYSTTLSLTSVSDCGILGGPGSTLKYTGTGDAVLVDGHLATNGARNISLSNFSIDAPLSTSCLHTIKFVNSDLVAVRCKGTSGTAFLNEFAVASHFIRPVASVNDGAFSHTPSIGFVIQGYLSTGSSDNTLLNPVIEGMTGDGIEFLNANGTTSIGGTSEGNGGRGLYIAGNSERSMVIGMDLESNAGACSSVYSNNCDVELASIGQRQTHLVNLVVQHNILVAGAPRETVIDGTAADSITINAGAVATTLTNGTRYNTLSDSGTSTNIYAANDAVANKLSNLTVTSGGSMAGTFAGNVTWSGTHIFSQTVTLSNGGAFSNQLGSSTGFLYSAYWTSVNANPAAAGQLRLAKGDTLRWRNNANSADMSISLNASDQLVLPVVATPSFAGVSTIGSTVVGSLPAASSNAGGVIRVTDSTAIASEGQTCVGGSSNSALAFSNGSVWKCF